MLGLAALAFPGVVWPWLSLARLACVALGMLTVLGTFFGILIGLLHFDVADVSRSVPAVTGRHKTAFLTSVVGAFTGLLAQLVAALFSRREEAAGDGGAGEMLALLRSVRDETAGARREMAASLEGVARRCGRGRAISSLVTQVRKLRGEVAEAFAREVTTLRGEVTSALAENRHAADAATYNLVLEVRKVSETLTEGVTAGLVRSLENLIRNLNSKLTEQFGENFKQFNAAVGRLLEWQENYRAQMVANASALRDGAAGLQAARVGVKVIASRSGAMVEAAEAMRTTVAGITTTREELDRRLGAFRDMAEEAQAAFPIIQSRLDEVTEGFAQDVRAAVAERHKAADQAREATRAQGQALTENSDQFTRAVEEMAGRSQSAVTTAAQAVEGATRAARMEAEATQKAAFEELRKGFERLREDSATSGEQVRQTVSSVEEILRSTITKAGDSINAELTRMSQAVTQQLQRTTEEGFKRITDGLNDQIGKVDKALGSRFDDVIEEFGTSMTSISSHFAKDYTPLANRLREVSRIAETLRPGSEGLPNGAGHHYEKHHTS